MATQPKANKVQLIAHCNFGKHQFTQLFFTEGKLHEGHGPYTKEIKLDFNTTLGAVRDLWGDDSVGAGLPPDTACAVWEAASEFEDETANAVVVEVAL